MGNGKSWRWAVLILGMGIGGLGCGGTVTEPRQDPPQRPLGKPIAFEAMACCGNDCKTGASLKDAHMPKGAPAATDGEPGPAPRAGVYRPGLIESEEEFGRVFGCSSGLDFSKKRVFSTPVGGINVHGFIWGVTEHEGEVLVYVESVAVCRGMAEDMKETLVVAVPAGKAPIKLMPTYKQQEPCGAVP